MSQTTPTPAAGTASESATESAGKKKTRATRKTETAPSTDPNTTLAPADNVYQAINAVMAELAVTGISKDRKNVQQHYTFRGIDDVYNALAPLLAKYGLVVMPHVENREVTERSTQRGGALFYVTLRVHFTFVLASNPESRHSVWVIGEAMDSGDKATNKAMSAAYKYAMLQVFCIPVEGESVDTEKDSHEVKHIKRPEVDEAQAERIKNLDEALENSDKTWKDARKHFAFENKREAANKYYDAIFNWCAEAVLPKRTKKAVAEAEQQAIDEAFEDDGVGF